MGVFWGYWIWGEGCSMGLSLPFPLIEIPMREQGTQIIASANIKLAEHGRKAILDGIRGNVQTGGDLTVGIP